MKKYINIALLILLTGSLSSCLKDKYDALNPVNSPSVVEFKNPDVISTLTPAGSLYSMYSRSLPSQETIDVTYTVQLSGSEPAAQDVTLTLGADPEAVAKFNTDQKLKNPTWTNYDLPDASLYSFKEPTAVIKAGTRSVDVVVSYKTVKFDFSKNYVFPLAIKTTNFGTVSKNFGTILLNISPKNIYDGIYSIEEGSVVNRYTNNVPNTGDALMGSLVGKPNRSLATVSGNAYTLSLTPVWANGGSVGGIDNLQIRVDQTTNEVTMVSLGNATLKNTVGKVNKYDPTTKTFTLNFDWSPGAASRDMSLILKYVGPRP